MKKLLLISALVLAGCTDNDSKMLSYDQLVAYPTSCDKSTEQLSELRSIQRAKNFDSDIEQLGEDDRAYNSRLKATIWWYTWKCGVQ
jgi:hypothetical protein